MAIAPPAVAGMSVDEVDTPALIIDLDAFERNLDRMAAAARDLGVGLRAHAKTHKSPIIAAQQIARGAVGQCCQKVGEAEILVAGGVRDVLVSNQVIGARKIDRVAALEQSRRLAHVARADGRVELSPVHRAYVGRRARHNWLVVLEGERRIDG